MTVTDGAAAAASAWSGTIVQLKEASDETIDLSRVGRLMVRPPATGVNVAPAVTEAIGSPSISVMWT